MAFNLSYGSFGDIITTIQLVYRVSQALSASRGSAREVQDLVAELRVFHGVLTQLTTHFATLPPSAALDSLINLVRPSILDTKDAIDAFLDRVVQKYGGRLLRQTGSKRGIADVLRMVQWNFMEKEEVKIVRTRVTTCKGTVTLAFMQAMSLKSDEDQNAINERIAALVNAEREAEKNMDEKFAEVMDKLEEGARTLANVEEGVHIMSTSLSSIRKDVVDVRQTTLTIEQTVIAMAQKFSRLDLQTENIVYLEDALGWQRKIILDYQPSWETVHSMLRDQFARYGSPGLKLIKMKRYSLQDSVTGREAIATKPFHQVVRPGQTLAMSMHLYGDFASGHEEMGARNESKCQRCGHVNMVVDSGFDVTCQRCDLTYRTIIDVSEEADDSIEKWMARKGGLNGDDDEEDDGQDDEDKQIELLTQEYLAQLENQANGIDIFKRVKLFTQWADRVESRDFDPVAVGTGFFWFTSVDNFLKDVKFQIQVSVLCQVLAYSSWIFPTHETFDEIVVTIGFWGRSRQRSMPILLISSDSKKKRRRAFKALKKLDWLGVKSRFLILTLPTSLLNKDRWKVIPFDPEVHVEAARRLHMIQEA